jgi:hypothetical protein
MHPQHDTYIDDATVRVTWSRSSWRSRASRSSVPQTGLKAWPVCVRHGHPSFLLDLTMPNMDGWTFREEQARLTDPALAGIPVDPERVTRMSARSRSARRGRCHSEANRFRQDADHRAALRGARRG